MKLPDGVVGVVGAEEEEEEDGGPAAGVRLDCGLLTMAPPPPSVDPMMTPVSLTDHLYVSNVSSWDCQGYVLSAISPPEISIPIMV